MLELEQTLDSREVAGMVEKQHKELMRDIRRYINQMIKGNGECEGERKIAPSDFFKESIYKTRQNKEMPCYRITKKGCEFIAHKLTGVKGTIFTARYINRFHEMQEVIARQKQKTEIPWFIRSFEGKYIMLFRDFEKIIGVKLEGNYTSLKRANRLQGGIDWNGWGWYTTVNKEEFKRKYSFDYGEDKCMLYLYLSGIEKAIRLYKEDMGNKANCEACKMIMDGMNKVCGKNREPQVQKHSEHIDICGTVSIRLDCGNRHNAENGYQMVISDLTTQ